MYSLRSILSAPLSLAVVFVTGCGTGTPLPAIAASQPLFVPGNWQIASSAPQASGLPSLSGQLSGTPAAISGIVHSAGGAACVPATTPIAVSGAANTTGHVTLTSAAFVHSTLTIDGQLASDGRSFQQAAYNVTGGACGFATAALIPAVATQYASIDGSYTGTFSDAGGPVLTIAATLAQNPAADTTGNFHLSGTGTFGTNPCFISPATVTNSQVTGGALNITYTDSTTLNMVAASGTFSADGKTLTIASWTLTGGCGSDTGSGSLTRP